MADSTGKKIKEALLGKDTVKVNGKTMKVVGGDVTTGALGVAKKVAEKAAAKAEIESFSKKGSELTKKTNKAINDQSKAASTYKTTDLAKSESAKKSAATRKENQALAEDMAHDAGYRKGSADKYKLAGAVGGLGIAAGAAGQYAVSKGSQKDHHVTTLTPKKK